MATRPTPRGLWASDTNFTNGPTGIPGTPTKVTPGAGVRAEGFIPQNKLPAQHMNDELNYLTQGMDWALALLPATEEHTYQVAKSRVVIINWASFHQMFADSTPGNVSGADAIPPWSEVYSGAGPDQYVNGLQSQSDVAKLMLNLNLIIPTGGTLTRIRAMVNPGTARATAGNRMRIKVYDNQYNFSAVTVGGTGSGPLYETTDDGSTNLQVIDTGVISNAIDKTVNAGGGEVLMVLAGNDAGTNQDLFYAVEITFTDPGPRNI